MKILYEVLVPTIYGDTHKPIKTKHHRKWDEKVKKITGGLTILQPVKGKWDYKNKEYNERVIPVRIMCEDTEIKGIIRMTLEHYRQIAVMYYSLSNDVNIVTKHDLE